MPIKKVVSTENSLPDRLGDGDISLKKLSFGLWYLRHRRLFYSLAIGTLVVLAIAGWIYGFYGLGRYFIFDRSQDRQSLLEIAQNGVNLLAGRTNQPLSISEVKVFGNNPSDLLAEIYNPNSRTAVYFKYSFTANGQPIVQREGFVLPGQRKYLVATGQQVPAGSAVQLAISQTFWQKLNARQIPDWPAFLSSHDQLAISDRQIGFAGSGGQAVTQVKFRLDNKTAYGYWSVPVLMLVYQGDNLVGVNELVLSKVKSGESRVVNFSWPGLSGADRLEVVTMVDYLNTSNYLPLED